MWGSDKMFFGDAVIGAALGASAGMAFTGFALQPGDVNALLAGQASLSESIRLAFVGLTAAAAGAAGAYHLGFQQAEWHYEGMEYKENPEEGRRTLQAAERLLMSKAQRDGKLAGIQIGGVEFSRKREVAHMIMIGLPGSGKTVLINSVISQVIKRGQRCIIHDPKGDFTSWLYDDGNSAVLMGPWDERATCWDIARDIRTPELASSFASSLVGDTSTNPNKFFPDAARETIAALIKYYQRTMGDNWSWDTLAEDLTSGADHIIKRAHEGDPLLKALIRDVKDKAVPGVISSVAVASAWIAAYAGTFQHALKRDANGVLQRDKMFSMVAWLAGRAHHEKRIVLFNNNKNYEIRARQIFGAMFAVTANYINSSEMPEIGADDERGLWLILDEFVQIGATALPVIQQIEELGRSRGVRVLKATQDESQFAALVGRDQSEAQKSVQQTRIYAMLATGSASALSSALGKRTMCRMETEREGAASKRVVKTDTAVVRVEELTGLKVLPDGVEIVAHVGDALCKLKQPFIDRATVAEKWPKIIDNKAWETSVLDYAQRSADASGGGVAGKNIRQLIADAKASGTGAPPPVPVPVPAAAPATEADFDPDLSPFDAFQSVAAADAAADAQPEADSPAALEAGQDAPKGRKPKKRDVDALLGEFE